MPTDLEQRIEAIGEQLRSKINSKFQVSAFLAGFAFTILSMQVSALWDDKKSPILISISICFMIPAIVLYIFSIIRLDELTMPKRFWIESGNMNMPQPGLLASLSDQDLWTLKDRMVFYWVRLTLTATWLTVISILLMLLPIPGHQNKSGIVPWFFFIVFIIVLVASHLYVKRVTGKASKLGSLTRPVD